MPLFAHSTVVEFPLVADPNYGLPAVRISTDRMTPPDNHTLPIHFGWTSTYAAGRNFGNNNRHFHITMEGAGTIESLLYMNSEFAPMRADLTGFIGFAVGPSSTFMNHFGSVSIIQNATSPIILAARSSQAYFESHCYPSSVAVARFDLFADLTIFAHAAFSDEDIPSRAPDIQRMHLSAAIYETALVLGTEDLYGRFRRRIFGLGAIPSDEEDTLFTNCTVLPDIHLHVTGRNPEDMYRIVIDGKDYIRHNPSDNTCRVSWTYGRSSFNPMRVPGLNVHYADTDRQYIHFCDSSF